MSNPKPGQPVVTSPPGARTKAAFICSGPDNCGDPECFKTCDDCTVPPSAGDQTEEPPS